MLMYLIFTFSDVPDPPENVILSEHNGRSVKLLWIPGDHHNSSITGNTTFTSLTTDQRSHRDLKKRPRCVK